MFSTVKERVDLRDLMAEAGVQFDRRGIMARCPFHDDRSPSLSVKNNRFRCFACGEAGDVFDFAEKFYRMDRKDALRFLGAKAGVQVDRPITPEIRREIEEAREKRRRREAFEAWIGAEKSRVGERIRYLTDEAQIISPATLGTNWARRIYDDLAKLEYRDEILWSHDDEAIVELYQSSEV